MKTPRRRAVGPTGLVLAAALTARTSAARADAPPASLTLEGAIRFALAHHPAVVASRADERVATARVDVARADELPHLGVAAELLRGTGNVVPGAMFPLAGIPPLSGPPIGREFTSGRWGSTVGVWGAWEVTDLARRMALVDAALADEQGARAGTDARRLEVAFEAADAFVAVLDAREAVRASESVVAREQAFATQVHALTEHDLRPGADAARADAEVALANIQLARARQALALRGARLAEALGVPGEPVDVAPGALLVAPAPPPAAPAARGPRPEHPLLVEADRAIEAAATRQRAVGLEYLPRLDLVAALFVRGSGYFPGGADLGAAQGLLPDTPNWAAGVTLSWPVLELFEVRARARVASAQVAFARARRSEVAQAIEGQLEAARAVLEGALAVARNTAPALAAARASEQQARARYDAGLGTAVDVADSERVLAQAELEDAAARLGVRRAMLLVARAAGDLTPFLVEARGGAPAAAAAGGR